MRRGLERRPRRDCRRPHRRRSSARRDLLAVRLRLPVLDEGPLGVAEMPHRSESECRLADPQHVQIDVAGGPGRNLGWVETLARVQAVIAELGYVPNAAARQLSRGRSGSVGLLVLDARNPFFNDLAAGVEEGAGSMDLAVLLATSTERADRERLYLDRFEQSRVDGLLVTPVGSSIKQLKAIRDRGTPIVLLDRLTTTPGFSSVAVDDIEGGRLAGQHLVDVGYRRIAFVGGPVTLEQVRNRLTGAGRAAEAADVVLSHLATTRMSAEAGRRVGSEIAAMPRHERPDGVFAANDLLALAILQALILAGIRVPTDIAVIGYDDIAFAALAGVPLSSIRQPSYQMGRRAMELLAGAMQADAESRATSQQVVFMPELAARASTLRQGSLA
jgi:LacI family transcriptional regulator